MQELMPYTNMVGFVLNKLETGTSFAVNVSDTSEQIFIPSQLANMQNIVPGDHINIRAIPNRKPGGAKWFAVFVSHRKADEEPVMPTAERKPEQLELPIDRPSQIAEQLAPLLEVVKPTEPEPKSSDPMDRQDYKNIVKALTDLGGVAAAKEIANVCGMETTPVIQRLERLHRLGVVARAGIRSRPDQKKDSYVFWAFSAKDLMPFDPEEEAQ